LWACGQSGFEQKDYNKIPPLKKASLTRPFLHQRIIMVSRRIAKISSRIKFLVTSIIQREISDPRVGFVTILRVEPTADIKEVKIYFSVLGDDAVKIRTLRALDQASGFIQKELGKNLSTKNTPHLTFVLDDTHDKQSRVEKLIEKSIQEDRTNHLEAEQSSGKIENENGN